MGNCDCSSADFLQFAKTVKKRGKWEQRDGELERGRVTS